MKRLCALRAAATLTLLLAAAAADAAASVCCCCLPQLLLRMHVGWHDSEDSDSGGAAFLGVHSAAFGVCLSAALCFCHHKLAIVHLLIEAHARFCARWPTPPCADAPAAPTTATAAAVDRMVSHLASPTPHATMLV